MEYGIEDKMEITEKRSWFKETIVTVIIIIAFIVIFIHYYFPIRDQINESPLGEYLRLNSTVYSPLESGFGSLGSFNPLPYLLNRNKNIDYSSFYYTDYEALHREM